MTMKKFILVAAARPNFMKVAPLVRAIERHNRRAGRRKDRLTYVLVHTGQHYDFNMSDSFFKDLKLPEPHIHLGVGSGSHAEQTGKVMIEFEKVLVKEIPDAVVVVGDVNSTLACTLAAVKLTIPVAHVEAGLRSFDRTMPEEINRLVTDALSTYLFTPSPDGDKNLLKEGISPEKIYRVGDIMIDSLFLHRREAKKSDILSRWGLQTGSSRIAPYALLTLHRPSNADDPDSLTKILKGLEVVSKKIPILFPVHPRTRKQLSRFGLQNKILFRDVRRHADLSSPGFYGMDPLGYLDFVKLMVHSKLIFTDSGGIQEEAMVLNIPCLTLRNTTERPITVTQGTNVLVWNDTQKIIREASNILAGKWKKAKIPALWDGKTAERIIHILTRPVSKKRPQTPLDPQTTPGKRT
jgi:UDP-N-acetylglucosamine 2-epimerase (non-hydrolysing)